MNVSFFIFIWLVIIPLATNRITNDITEEKIFERTLAWIEARFRGTWINYLIRCPLCLSHWIIFFVALGFCENFASLPCHNRLLLTALLVFATVEIQRILRFLLERLDR